MNNKKISKAVSLQIEGLTKMLEGYKLLAEELLVMPDTDDKEVKNEKAVAKKEVEVDHFDREALSKMKYNEFKKLASSLGVKCTGTRDEIMERILNLQNEEEVEEVAEEVEETKVTEETEVTEEDDVEEEEEDDVDYEALANEIAEDTDVEDIIEALAEVGVKATKKTAVKKLAKALEEGLISLEDDEEEEEPPFEEDNAEDEAEIEAEEVELSADVYVAELDPNGYNDPENMTKERKKAVLKEMQSILDKVEKGKLGEDDITDFLENFATQEEIDILGDDYEDTDLVLMYMELKKRFIDNDGDVHEPADPYELGETDMCCGHELKYSEDTEKYICEFCGTEYEAE